MMGIHQNETSERILDLTLEIIYVLTGYDYILTKKPCDGAVHGRHPYLSKESSRTQNSGTEPPSQSPTRDENSEKKILDLTNKIIQLLTGQVPLQCEDLAVYFSTEEWEYVEKHKELYKDVVKDTHQPQELLGEAERRAPNWFPIPVFSTGQTDINNPGDKYYRTINTPQKSLINHIGKKQDCSVLGNVGNPTDVSQPSKDLRTELRPVHIQKQRASCRLDVYIPVIERTLAHTEPKPVQDDIEDLPDVSSSREHSQVEDVLIHITEVKSLSLESDLVRASVNRPTAHARTEEITYSNETFRVKEMSALEKTAVRREYEEQTNQGREKCFAEHQSRYTVEKPFSCSECAERFTDKQRLFRHQLVHSEDYTPEGDRTFLYESRVMGHHEVHLQAKTLISSEYGTPAEVFSCSECEQIFFDRQRLFRHQFLHLHNPQKAFPCPECKRTFTSEAGLTTHQRSHKKTPIVCGECGKSFKQTASLLHHQWTHTGVKAFVCKCGKRYTSQSALCSHQRVHTGEKPYVCSECGKCFHKKSILNSHMMVHTGLKPYLCTECGVSYCHKKDLTKHQLTHEKEKSNAIQK